MSTFHIHLEGLVQGIGFRPFVYQLAVSRGLNGMVSNGADGVHILLNASKEAARNFLACILETPPPLAQIEKWHIASVPSAAFSNFSIQKEDRKAMPRLQITPDLGVCPACKKEIRDAKDRRYGYAFNTCIHCGPRFSIMENLPYDRENTVMDSFEMCPECLTEYEDPATRRHFSQTNSCPSCGIRMTYYKKTETGWKTISERNADLIAKTVEALSKGEILAIKGIGGFLLVCDATNTSAISTLRKRKSRPQKPFAVMFPDESSLQQYAIVTRQQRKAYSAIESPIVLFEKRKDVEFPFEEIAPGLDALGAMQAYTPLFQLILDAFKKPIIATSGNTSGAPICYRDDRVKKDLGHLVEGIVTNNRPIRVPQDDSLLRYSKKHHRKIFLRRSRGFVPSFITNLMEGWDKNGLLAMGADLKASFGLYHLENTYISPYLGNLESYDSQESFKHSLQHLLSLLEAKPSHILIDKHPAYFSHSLGKQLAEQYRVSVETVEHHKAHFTAVLGENQLLSSNEKILGVIWDGTGWGKDAQHILGGEFFIFEKGAIESNGSLEAFPLLMRDKMAREPRLSALALIGEMDEAIPLLKKCFKEKEWIFYQKVLQHKKGPTTSSMGRLFDGMAALLGLNRFNSFEGEAAMSLEQLARKAYDSGYAPTLPPGPYPLQKILRHCLAMLLGHEKNAAIALAFHKMLVSWIFDTASAAQTRHIAFSGGVFQNALLVDLLLDQCPYDHRLYFHQKLSPNDENIAFGQLCYFFLQERNNTKASANHLIDKVTNNEICV